MRILPIGLIAAAVFMLLLSSSKKMAIGGTEVLRYLSDTAYPYKFQQTGKDGRR